MPSLEAQIIVLKQAGIKLKPGVTIGKLLTQLSREQYEADPYVSLLCVMGNEERFSNDAWYFDTECVEGPGSYAVIARRIRDLSGGALPLEEIEDDVDNNGISRGFGTLSFRLYNQWHRWQIEIDNDWVDGSVFTRFDELLAQQNTGKRFAAYGLGQDMLIVCLTPEQSNLLKAQADLKLEWLS